MKITSDFLSYRIEFAEEYEAVWSIDGIPTCQQWHYTEAWNYKGVKGRTKWKPD